MSSSSLIRPVLAGTHADLAETMLVYRVEDDSGYGYKTSLDSAIGSATCIDFVGYEVRRPLPCDDGIDIVDLGEGYFFGFDSIESFKSWFLLNERNAGAHFGGQILIIEVQVDHVVKGGRQLAFDSRYSKTLESHPLNWFDSPAERAIAYDDGEE